MNGTRLCWHRGLLGASPSALGLLMALLLPLLSSSCEYNPKFKSGVVECDPAPAKNACPTEISHCVPQAGGKAVCCATLDCNDGVGGQSGNAGNGGRAGAGGQAGHGGTGGQAVQGGQGGQAGKTSGTGGPNDGGLATGGSGGAGGQSATGGGLPDGGSSDGSADGPNDMATVEVAPVCVNDPCNAKASDGCCPSKCTAATDVDCAGCGNGKVETALGETCEGTSCPTTCPSTICKRVTLVGKAETCNAKCMEEPVTQCLATSDNCCPSDGTTLLCNATNDPDCAAVCGNSKVESGESCDPVTDCQSKSTACTDTADLKRTKSGDPTRCTFTCSEAKRNCQNDDGYCPSTCGPTNDNDCKGCGNGKPDQGETCDPPSDCQAKKAACVGDTNTVRTPSGDPTKCTFVCGETFRACTSGDGFCPSTCGATSDHDCPGCGNGRTDGNETCDGTTCTTISNNCPGQNSADVVASLSGSASTCNVACNTSKRACGPADGYCPTGCSSADADCPQCTNGTSQACPNDPSNVITCTGGRWPTRPTPCPADCPTSINDKWTSIGYGTSPWKINWPPGEGVYPNPTVTTSLLNLPFDTVVGREPLPGGYVVTFQIWVDNDSDGMPDDYALYPAVGNGAMGRFPAVRRQNTGNRLVLGGLWYGPTVPWTTFGAWNDTKINWGSAILTIYVKAGALTLAAVESAADVNVSGVVSGAIVTTGVTDPTGLQLIGSNSKIFTADRTGLLGKVGPIRGCAGLTDGQVDYLYGMRKTYPSP